MERSDTLPEPADVPSSLAPADVPPPAPEEDEVRNDVPSVLDKMMNMVMHLRHELELLWNKNAMLEKELAKKNNALRVEAGRDEKPVVRGDEGDGEATQQPPADEGDGGEAVESVNDVRTQVECLSPSDHGLEGAIV
jgi:hypothetical protein